MRCSVSKKYPQKYNCPCRDCGYANHEKPWKNSKIFKGICEKYQAPVIGEYNLRILCPDWKPTEKSLSTQIEQVIEHEAAQRNRTSNSVS